MASPFASRTQKTIPSPLDPPHTITVRKLTGIEVEAAQESHRGSLAAGSTRSWAGVFRRALEKGASDAAVLKALDDPLTGYDRFSVARSGLLAWTYPESLKPVTVKGVGDAPDQVVDAIAELDDETVDFIATEIMRLTKPGLFKTPEQMEEERKNG